MAADRVNKINLSVQNIKDMDERDRNKIRVEELLKVILNIEQPQIELKTLNDNITELNKSISEFRNDTVKNSESIIELNTKNVILNNDLIKLRKNFAELSDKINDSEQRSRNSSIEIAGLRKPANGETDESLAVSFINNVLNVEISSDTVASCHEVPTKRTDGKRVVICRFISEKTKMAVLKDKSKKLRKYNDDQRKTNNNIANVLIYEHLSPYNRKIYALTAKLKYEQQWKFHWTKKGTSFLRKDEHSPAIKIKAASDLATLA